MLIEDFALIGDCETAALVARDGSIAWLCWPFFDSPACFASLLGSEQNGFWSVAPAGKVIHSSRTYEQHSLILKSTHQTEQGMVEVTDFMPIPRNQHSRVLRVVKGVSGCVSMTSTLVLRFNYGQAIPWVTRTETGICAVVGPDTVWLHAETKLEGKHLETVSKFEVNEGQEVTFELVYGTYGNYDGKAAPKTVDVEQTYRQTCDFWASWASRCNYRGEYREPVMRSLVTLKSLIFRPTGGMVAAPTTSLPEDIGGSRNWDYRYCWLRDTTLTLLVLMNSAYYDEARDWARWLRRTVAVTPHQLQIMYGIYGQRTLTEWEVKWLVGYENSSPVRVGNAASEQVQLDVYGEVLQALFLTLEATGEGNTKDHTLLVNFVEYLETIWDMPDEGIWEIRGGPKHFTYSKVMAWLAFDRAVKIAERSRLDAPIERWKGVRETIHKQICENGFDKALNSFTQYYGSKELDASLLLLILVGFLPPEDPRMRGTVEAVERHLLRDGLVMRYNPIASKDGLAGGEGMFLACSFWLVSSLCLIGRAEYARMLFEHLLSLTNDLGLLSEEYDTKRHRLVGNFPQALSHIALISAAYHLAPHR